MKDKREIIWECLRDRATSADAILNALHQAGWAIVPKEAPSDQCVCVSICGDRDPDGVGVCKGLSAW